MTKLYCMTLLALVCASISISVNAKGAAYYTLARNTGDHDGPGEFPAAAAAPASASPQPLTQPTLA